MIINGSQLPESLDDAYGEWEVLPFDSPERQVEILFCELSEAVMSAGWVNGLSEIIWRWIQNGLPPRRSWKYGEGTVNDVAGWLDELRHLTVDQGWWPAYEDHRYVARKLSIPEWEAMLARSEL